MSGNNMSAMPAEATNRIAGFQYRSAILPTMNLYCCQSRRFIRLFPFR